MACEIRCYFADFRKSDAQVTSSEAFQRALHYAALTTNRSFDEFRRISQQSTDGVSDDTSSDSGLNVSVRLPQRFIAYFSGNASLHVFWRLGQSNTIKHAQSVVTRSVLSHAIEQVLASYATAESRPMPPESRLLAGWLLPRQLCDDLRVDDQRPVVIAPHGPLFQIPLEGLPLLGSTSSEMLGDRCPLIYVPTLATSTELTADSAKGDAVSHRVLIIRPGWGIGDESLAIERQFPGEVTSVNRSPEAKAGKDDTLLARVSEQLKSPAGWELIYIGAHGRGAKDNQSSSIALGGADLTATDLQTIFSPRRLSAQHVWLAVCESQVTTRGDLRSGGNTLKALGTSFLAVGAHDVIASHWNVNDLASKELYEQLTHRYKSIREARGQVTTEELAHLLFEARHAVKQKADFAAPYYWNCSTIWTTVDAHR